MKCSLLSGRTKYLLDTGDTALGQLRSLQDVIELSNSVHKIKLNTINETPKVMKDQLFWVLIWRPVSVHYRLPIIHGKNNPILFGIYRPVSCFAALIHHLLFRLTFQVSSKPPLALGWGSINFHWSRKWQEVPINFQKTVWSVTSENLPRSALVKRALFTLAVSLHSNFPARS